MEAEQSSFLIAQVVSAGCSSSSPDRWCSRSPAELHLTEEEEEEAKAR